jgi:RecQ family ATP-dependent DNA helicase
MEPFVYLPEYPVVICKTCEFACVADEVISHLRLQHVSIKPSERNKIAKLVKEIPGIVHNQAGLSGFQFPPATTAPILFIAAPKIDGLRCNDCGFVTRTLRGIQGHCREKHGWVNDWRKGGNVAKKAKQERGVPWTTGVRCQRFFRSRVASQWFEVGRASESSEPPSGDQQTAEGLVEMVRRRHQEQAALFKTAGMEMIRVADDKKEPNPWLTRAGWAEHLRGLSPDRLREAAGPIGDEEAVLWGMWQSLERVLDRARATAVAGKVGLAALFEVQRKEMHVKPRKPFDNRLEDDTWQRYKGVWRTLLCIWQRTQMWDDDKRPPYQLTIQQGDLYDEFENAVERAVEGSNEGVMDEEKVDRMCLDMVIGMLDHQFKQGHYNSILLSGLAVMGIREDGGWVAAEDYTSIYSAVIKVARMLVVYQSYLEREDEVAEKMRTMSEEEAREAAQGMFGIIRAKVRRFMTLVSDKDGAEPTPMDWIFDTRSYGMRIRFTTPADGKIDWQGDRVVCGRVRFSMGQLSDMLHAVVGEARTILTRLAMVEPDDIQALPAIEWAKMEDDHSEDRVGYSFLQDDRNTWVEKGKDWVLQRIMEAEQRRKEWVSNVGEGCPYRAKAVRAYGQMVEQFRERLWMMMHMLGGQPARTTEITGIRMANTANGGLRNIFAHNGMMCFVTSYHKNYRSTGQAKVIHRYLPREVGELLVWYMWLVLGFWQEVQGMVKAADRCSAFLWADEVVSREEGEQPGAEEAGEGQEEPRTEGTEEMEGREGFEEWIRERKWTLDRVRRVVQRHSERLMGQKINISAWRHIAIAIANRHLNKAFGQDNVDGEGGEEDEDGIEDSAWDLQAGHGTHVAGMVYARELQQGVFSTAPRRERFRAVSRQWHRFLGFGAEDSSAAGAGVKRTRDAFEGAREEARFRRFQRLRQVDIHGQLRQMMGEEAAFRGNQEAVIRAIVRGESPIVQITGTGGGKSLSFILPAFCSPDGVTIVVVPLVSLRADLYERCTKSGIEAHVWQSRQSNRAASIVFVTPESAVTKGFREFVNRLQVRQELDRVVVDECHVVPDGKHGFRPQMQELGRVLRELGVQLVFLTATLAPRDEEDFYRVLGLAGRRVCMFRSRTTRKNIAYRVRIVQAGERKEQEEEEDQVVCRTVERWMRRNESGKVIVYGGSIERVERVGEMLSCEVYHSKVDTVEGKIRRLKEWMKGGRLIVATNALGLGVDVPDVRLVVHVGMPRRLRDYVQESGRAGRDGGVSKAIVVCGRIRSRSGAEESEGGRQGWEDVVVEYIEGKRCRRAVLDEVMDGWIGRLGCAEAEESCDVCKRMAGRMGSAEGEAEQAEDVEVEDEFRRQQRQGRFERWMIEKEAMDEGEEVEAFREQLASWAGCCVVCRLGGAEEDCHEMDECPRQDEEKWATIELGIRRIEEEIFKRRRLERFSGCFQCGLPQAICERWVVADEDGGRFTQVRGGRCQYQGLIAKLYAGVYAYFTEEAEEVMREMMGRDESDGELGVEWYTWLGGRIQWGGLETNRLCRGFYRLSRIVGERVQ